MKLFLSAPNSSAVSRRRVCPANGGASVSSQRGGRDVTEAYRRGAEAALALCQQNGCEAAVLKEKSPSCGCGQIYDGTFSRRLIAGDGVTAEALKAHGITIYGESDAEKL